MQGYCREGIREYLFDLKDETFINYNHWGVEMNVMVVSDIHEDGDFLERLVEQHSPDFVLSCGDHGEYYLPKFPMYFVFGNHENFALISTLRSGQMDIDGLTLIEPGDTELVTDGIEELRVAGLGGIYRPEHYEKHRSDAYFMEDDVSRLQNCRDADVLLFHETLPSMGIVRGGKPMGCPDLDRVVTKIQPKYVFSGHYSQLKETSQGQTTQIALDRVSKSFVMLKVKAGEVSHQTYAL